MKSPTPKIINCILILFIFSFLFACNSSYKNGTVTGKLENIKGGKIFLQQITDSGDVNIDSSGIKSDGSFRLSNPAKGTDFYVLRADSVNVIFLVLKAGENAIVNGNARELEKTYTVQGSKDSELLKQLRAFDRHLSDSLNSVYASIRQLNPAMSDSAGLLLQQNYTSTMEKFAKDFIGENISSVVSLSATKFLNQQTEIELMKELQDSLEKILPDNRYVADYKQLMKDLVKLPTGSLAPEISMNTADGKKINLSSLRGKIVLVDFWASWCAPCRRENPSLVELYKRFKGKDFEIYGVSLDENVISWNEAVRKDNIGWIQVSDLNKWESSAVKDYHIEAIPYSVLIDRDGKIIAKGLQSDELTVKIIEALARKNS